MLGVYYTASMLNESSLYIFKYLYMYHRFHTCTLYNSLEAYISLPHISSADFLLGYMVRSSELKPIITAMGSR